MAELKEELRKAVIKAQADEETGVVLYSYLAESSEANAEVILTVKVVG